MVTIFSYIDPGSTALVWQILAGVLIVFGVVLGIWWTKITTFFKGIWAKLFGKKNAESETNEALEEIMDEPEQGEESCESSETSDSSESSEKSSSINS